jgi:hypothetical protein
MRLLMPLTALVLSGGCAHFDIAPSDLDQVHRPAFVSRIAENGGPQSRVFRDDWTYHQRLTYLEPPEADRRLQAKLSKALTRFQLSEGLRAALFSLLPHQAPWTGVVPPDRVASTLESFLVEEVPANTPDYELLRPLGADAVLELVVQDYGLHSRDGHAQPFVAGYGRLFWLGGSEIWRHGFRRDRIDVHVGGLDPFEVGKDPTRFRDAFGALIESVAEELANSLRGPPRRPSEPPPTQVQEPTTPNAPTSPGPAAPRRPRLPEDEL